MIQCCASDVEGWDREKDVWCLDVRKELSIYNSPSCLTGLGVNVTDVSFSLLKIHCSWTFGSSGPLWAWAALLHVLLWSFDPHTRILKEPQPTGRYTRSQICSTHTTVIDNRLLHLTEQHSGATYSNTPLHVCSINVPWVIKRPWVPWVIKTPGTLISKAKITFYTGKRNGWLMCLHPTDSNSDVSCTKSCSNSNNTQHQAWTISYSQFPLQSRKPASFGQSETKLPWSMRVNGVYCMSVCVCIPYVVG